MNLATYMSLVDPLSGRIDFDQIHFGQTRQQRMMSQRVADAIKAVLAAAGAASTAASSASRATGVTREFIFSQVKERMRQTGGIYEIIEPNVVFNTISRLEKEQVISKRGGGLYYLSVAPQPGEEEN